MPILGEALAANRLKKEARIERAFLLLIVRQLIVLPVQLTSSPCHIDLNAIYCSRIVTIT
nr:MAG TPA: hypothetical protein [Caudoviricetes sp.]